MSKQRDLTPHGPTPTPRLCQIDGIGVGEWCPTPDGTGPAEAVVLHFTIPDAVRCVIRGTGEPVEQLGVRLKSRSACNDLISVLEHHMANVFPVKN